jgi:hypothetical protein
MCYIFVQMVLPVFHEFDAEGTIRTNGLHWEVFHVLRGKHSAPLVTLLHQLTRCPTYWVFPVAG